MRKTVKLLLSLAAFSGVAGAQADMQRIASDAFNARDWTLLWEGRRPSDRDERFRLYRRAR